MYLGDLIAMSRKYGADRDYVLEGGGNTSYKEDGVMAVKASGAALGEIHEEGFVLMDAGRLRAMTQARYPESDDARESCAIRDMMEARAPGQGEKRPSVECILHAIFPQSYVLHVHPALINGLTCAVGGEDAAGELFAGMEKELLWVPLTKPGFILSKACADAFEVHRGLHGAYPKVLLLQNHGVFVAGQTVAEIDGIMAEIVGRIRSKVTREPDFTDRIGAVFPPAGEKGVPVAAGAPETVFEGEPAGFAKSVTETAAAIAASSGGDVDPIVSFIRDAEIARLTDSRDSAEPLMRPFTPDHIVYAGAFPLWIGRGTDIPEAFRAFAESNGFVPRTALAEGLGAFTFGGSAREVEAAAALLTDAVKIAVYSEAFGGPSALPDDFTSFILNWEIESYRQKRSFG
jgi:rhamnose utilization protein RhaD (predicted bifunctional aldolase and dehydrogenase)